MAAYAGFMTHLTCRLTASSGTLRSVIEHGLPLPFTDFTDSPDCLLILLSIYFFLRFSFSVFPLFSCWFRAVDYTHSCKLSSAR